MSLDDKLKTLVDDLSSDGPYEHNVQGQQEFVAAIKQAFADEGYVYVPQVEMVTRFEAGKPPELFMVNGKEVMTGQEWYDRLISIMSEYNPNDPFNPMWQDKLIRDIAKRAANLKENV